MNLWSQKVYASGPSVRPKQFARRLAKAYNPLFYLKHLRSVSVDLFDGILWGPREGHFPRPLIVDIHNEWDQLWLGHPRLQGEAGRPGISEGRLRESHKVSVQGDGCTQDCLLGRGEIAMASNETRAKQLWGRAWFRGGTLAAFVLSWPTLCMYVVPFL